MLKQSQRIFGLDLIRTIAISLVLASHVSLLLFPNSSGALLLSIRAMGAIGVDLFFVLSGYLIGGILLREIEKQRTTFTHLLTFWKRRWLRTLPNYFLILIVNITLYLVIGFDLPSNLVLYFPFLQNFAWPHPDFFTEAWSLSIEEYAYLVLPVLLYLGYFLFSKLKKQRLFLVITFLSIIGLLLIKSNYYLNEEVLSYSDWSASFRKVVIYRLDAIYIGFLLVYLTRYFKNVVKRFDVHLFVLGVLVFIALHFIIYKYQLLPETNLFFYVFIYLQTIIISLALLFPYLTQIHRQGFIQKLVQFISIRSYAIYLVNYSLVLLSIQSLVDIQDESLVFKLMIIALFLVITFILSHFIFKYFERPILNFRDKNFKR